MQYLFVETILKPAPIDQKLYGGSMNTPTVNLT